MINMICLRLSTHNKQFSGHKIDPLQQFPLCNPKTTKQKSHSYLINNLLLPLFATSKGEKKQVLDGLLTVSSCAIGRVALQKRGKQKSTIFDCAVRVG
jgi:hypothetical protein